MLQLVAYWRRAMRARTPAPGGKAMADLGTHVADVKKYTGAADEAAVAGLVKYLGIALQSRDSSLVSSKDPKEVARVRDGFLKKKLGQSDTDAKLDAAIASVLDKVKADRSKSRVTVYYLLAQHFKKLDLFKAAAKPATGKAPAAKAAAATGAKAPAKSSSAPPPKAPAKSSAGK